jgi:hypothetical protein
MFFFLCSFRIGAVTNSAALDARTAAVAATAAVIDVSATATVNVEATALNFK